MNTYRHAELEGVAWRVLGPEVLRMYDPLEDDFYEEETSMVRAVMVGDDREHIVDPDDLVPIEEGDFCAGCGQIGCGHGG